MDTGSIRINNKTYPIGDHQTILDIARSGNIDIPTLCHLEGTRSHGKCGICAVQVNAGDSLVRACETIATDGMIILTESPAVVAERKRILMALLESGNHNCSIGSSGDTDWTGFQMQSIKDGEPGDLCPKWGSCTLQDLAYQYQVQWSRKPLKSSSFTRETVNPLIERDFSRCILCGKCVAACNEIQANQAIRMPEDDEDRHVIAGKNNTTLKDSDCVFCGECVQVCPTGALVETKSRTEWRPWDAEKIRTTCPYCGVGCQQILHVRDQKIVKVEGAREASPNKGRLCVKGRFGYDFIYSKERLTTPLIREKNGFREASWDEALDLVSQKFSEIIREHGPDALAGVSCARSINEDSYQMQKLFRAVFKTNNIDHCART